MHPLPSPSSSRLEASCANYSIRLLALFGALLLATVVQHPVMFRRRHGRAHRVMGAAHLCVLALGACDVATFTSQEGAQPLRSLLFDVLLAVSGTALTLTAASGFGHRNVRNPASGALDKDATVSHAEMVEHAFYQILNGIQAVYLHALAHVSGRAARSALCVAATAPWLARHLFPTHSFSANYANKPATREAVLYRVKKWQYVLYKHALLHGINVCAAMLPNMFNASGWVFRLYWLLLNSSYVLEFFLQTLVKRNYMRQSTMLTLNMMLMAAASLAAAPVVARVHPLVAAASLALNFARRGRDLSNVVVLLIGANLVLWKHV